MWRPMHCARWRGCKRCCPRRHRGRGQLSAGAGRNLREAGASFDCPPRSGAANRAGVQCTGFAGSAGTWHGATGPAGRMRWICPSASASVHKPGWKVAPRTTRNRPPLSPCGNYSRHGAKSYTEDDAEQDEPQGNANPTNSPGDSSVIELKAKHWSCKAKQKPPCHRLAECCCVTARKYLVRAFGLFPPAAEISTRTESTLNINRISHLLDVHVQYAYAGGQYKS